MSSERVEAAHADSGRAAAPSSTHAHVCAPVRTRIQYTMNILPGQADAYIASHQSVWPELLALHARHGVHNFRISMHPDRARVFVCVEVCDVAQWHAIADTETCKRWWAYMENFVEFADGRPVATPLTEVFFQA